MRTILLAFCLSTLLFLTGCNTGGAGNMPEAEQKSEGQLLADQDWVSEPQNKMGSQVFSKKDDPIVKEIDGHIVSLEKKTEHQAAGNPLPLRTEIRMEISRIELEIRQRGRQDTCRNIAMKLDEFVQPGHKIKIGDACNAYIASHSQ